MTASPRLLRSRDDRMIAGICGGIAEHFGWSATAVRVGYVALSILSAGFPGMLVYIILWLVIPDSPPESREFRVDDPGGI